MGTRGIHTGPTKWKVDVERPDGTRYSITAVDKRQEQGRTVVIADDGTEYVQKADGIGAEDLHA